MFQTTNHILYYLFMDYGLLYYLVTFFWPIYKPIYGLSYPFMVMGDGLLLFQYFYNDMWGFLKLGVPKNGWFMIEKQY